MEKLLYNLISLYADLRILWLYITTAMAEMFLHLVCGVCTAVCMRWRVVQEERAQGQDADSTQGGGDQDGEHRQGQDLSPHVLPLVLPVLDAVIKEHGAQSS